MPEAVFKLIKSFNWINFTLENSSQEIASITPLKAEIFQFNNKFNKEILKSNIWNVPYI